MSDIAPIPGWGGAASGDVDPGAIYLGSPAGISAYADQQTDAAHNFILTLGTLAASLAPPTIDPVFPAGPAAPPQITATPPILQTIVWTSPDAPAAFTEVLDVTSVMPDPFDEDPPTLNFGSAPAAFSEVAPSSPGINLVFEDPDLTVELPVPPELITLNITAFDGITLPDAVADVASFTIVAPSIREYTPGAQYTSALLADLRAYLNDVMVNGGTGLNSDVENAIWDRGREREAKSRSDALKDLDKMEELGFALPPGVYLDARLKITTESDFANRGLSREIMIKQAELALDTTQKSIVAATELESKSMDYANSVEQRLFDATKYATEAGISIYNAQVQAYGAYVEAYKTKVQIYTAEVQAQIALVDAYKAQIEAESAKAQVNTALVEQYKVQADVALSAIEIYKAQIAGIQTKAEIEKIKIEAYGSQIQAYVAKVNAYTAGVEGYRASLEAEATKEKIYQAQVEAFSARVEAAAKEADIQIAAFKGRLEVYSEQWEGYKAAIAGEASKAQAISAYNQSVSAEYQAEVTAFTSYNETLTKQWQVALDQAQRVSDIGVNAAKANAELYITTRSLALDAAKVGAQVSAQLGAAALNAINWSQSVSTSVSNAISTSYGNSYSQSVGFSDSTSHNYNYSASV